MNNEWRQVDGFEGRYLVNRDGELLRKQCLDGKGRKLSEKLLKAYLNQKLGYYVYSISFNGKNKVLYMHRLIAEAFIPKIEGKPGINHKDGDKQNNSIANLEWVTHKENIQHAFRTGLVKNMRNGSGDECHASKLNSGKVAEIKALIASGVTQKTIAEKYGVAKGTIGFIARGETWTQVQAHAAGTLGIEFA